MVITIDSCDSSLGGPSIIRMLMIAKPQLTKEEQFSKQDKHGNPVHLQANKYPGCRYYPYGWNFLIAPQIESEKKKTPQVAN